MPAPTLFLHDISAAGRSALHHQRQWQVPTAADAPAKFVLVGLINIGHATSACPVLDCRKHKEIFDHLQAVTGAHVLLQAEQQLRRDLSSMQAQLAQAEGQAARLQTSRAQLELQLQQLQARSAPCIMIQGKVALLDGPSGACTLLNGHSPSSASLLCHAVQVYCLPCRLRAGSSLGTVKTWLVCMM